MTSNIILRVVMALFDKSLLQIVPAIGLRRELSNTRSREVLDLSYRDLDETIRETSAAVLHLMQRADP